MQYDKRDKLRYIVRGKKSFPVTTNGQFNFNIKGRCDIDKEYKQVNWRYKAFPCLIIIGAYDATPYASDRP